MMDEKAYSVQIQSDSWKGAITAMIFSLVLSYTGEEVDGGSYAMIRAFFEKVRANGWKFTADQMIAFCLDPTKTIEDLQEIAEAIEEAGCMNEETFDALLAATTSEEPAENG